MPLPRVPHVVAALLGSALLSAPAQTAPNFPVIADLTLCYPTGTYPCPGNEVFYTLTIDAGGVGSITSAYAVDPITWSWDGMEVVIDYDYLDDYLTGAPNGAGCAEGVWHGTYGNYNWIACP